MPSQFGHAGEDVEGPHKYARDCAVKPATAADDARASVEVTPKWSRLRPPEEVQCTAISPNRC